MTSFDPALPALDVVATLSSDRRTMYIAATNRDETRDITASLHVRGWKVSGSGAIVYELNAATADAANPYGSTSAVHIQQRNVQLRGLSYRFPAHSVSVLEIGGMPER